jgi:hypothetical protein
MRFLKKVLQKPPLFLVWGSYLLICTGITFVRKQQHLAEKIIIIITIGSTCLKSINMRKNSQINQTYTIKTFFFLNFNLHVKKKRTKNNPSLLGFTFPLFFLSSSFYLFEILRQTKFTHSKTLKLVYPKMTIKTKREKKNLLLTG